jgi:hypothetical protein
MVRIKSEYMWEEKYKWDSPNLTNKFKTEIENLTKNHKTKPPKS